MRIICFITVFLLLFLSCSCGGDEDNEIMIMSWNVQNYFDDVSNGTEYSEFDPSEGVWDTDCFNRKAAAIAEVVLSVKPSGPEVVVLQEVENENALSLLNDMYLKECGYCWSAFLPTQDSAIGNAVLSRLEITDISSHSVHLENYTAGRAIAEIRLKVDELSEIVLFANHWKSRSGGAEETEPQRLAASKRLFSLIQNNSVTDIDSIEGRECLIIAAGDFNESWDEQSRVGGAYQVALRMSGDEDDSGCIRIADVKTVMEFESEGLLYNPWIDSDFKGSYSYRGSWETLDQFFFDRTALDGKGFEFKSFSVHQPEFMLTEYKTPLRWITSAKEGFSDHFPVITVMERF